MAKGIRGNTIRSHTGSCNRESRPGYKRLIAGAKFGIYRPLTAESSEQIGAKVSRAQLDVDKFLGGRKIADQKARSLPQKNLGVTYLLYDHSGEALHKKRIDIFAGKRIMNAVAASNDIVSSLEVPINGLDWRGARDRKLSAEIKPFSSSSEVAALQTIMNRIGPMTEAEASLVVAKSTALEQVQELKADALALDGLMSETSSEALSIRLRTPDHLSLINYAGSCDPHVANSHRNRIRDIVSEHLGNEPLTIGLGKMVIGSNYSEPLQLAA